MPAAINPLFYYGNKSKQSVEDWCRNFRNQVYINRWSDSIAIYHLKSRMSGEAAEWLKKLISSNQRVNQWNINEWTASLINHFKVKSIINIKNGDNKSVPKKISESNDTKKTEDTSNPNIYNIIQDEVTSDGEDLLEKKPLIPESSNLKQKNIDTNIDETKVLENESIYMYNNRILKIYSYLTKKISLKSLKKKYITNVSKFGPELECHFSNDENIKNKSLTDLIQDSERIFQLRSNKKINEKYNFENNKFICKSDPIEIIDNYLVYLNYCNSIYIYNLTKAKTALLQHKQRTNNYENKSFNNQSFNSKERLKGEISKDIDMAKRIEYLENTIKKMSIDHSARDSKLELICYKCSKVGHMKKNCKQNKKA
ncbi:hypothetical protein BB561_003144 [Smittium simulii]|uniref:CCHC-type domain-containing protein n=1 Tax=Smittium simulii TaxID=133385 RepID=A0A2T9YMT8_9FUNG|nr:hypothetical protein BB561_003144 [Smittium simulii]